VTYKYKKGWQVSNGKPVFCFAISSNKLEAHRGGLAKIINETENVNDYIEFCKNENAKKIALLDIEQKEFDLIIERLKENIDEIEIYYSNLTTIIHHDKLSLCKKITRVLIECNRGKVALWDVSNNPMLEKLEITGIEKLYNQERLMDAVVKALIIRNRDYSLSDTKVPIIEDFSVFETMPNLKILDLFVGKKKNKVDDLMSLSKLKNIEIITLPKNYFYFNQYAWLSSKLPHVKGIGCIKEEIWNKQIEKKEYTINGTRMAWEFKDYWGTGINKYLKKFDDLVDKYKYEDDPPKK